MDCFAALAMTWSYRHVFTASPRIRATRWLNPSCALLRPSLRAERSNPSGHSKKEWIASWSLSSGGHSADPLARNDGVDGLTQTASSAKAWSPKRHRGKPSMKKFIRTAIDLGKTYFQVHGLESEGGQSI